MGIMVPSGAHGRYQLCHSNFHVIQYYSLNHTPKFSQDTRVDVITV